jgi:hypothetical protein
VDALDERVEALGQGGLDGVLRLLAVVLDGGIEGASGEVSLIFDQLGAP